MPPRPGKKKGVVIDGVNTTSMSREQIQDFALRLKEETDREREERNIFQMERDKIRTFWDITRTELEEAQTKLRNKDHQIEEERQNNKDELTLYQQKVKHMQYEQQNDLTECKSDALSSIKKALDEHTEKEQELLQDKRSLKSKANELENSHEDKLKSMALQYSEEIYKARQELEANTKEMELKFEKKFANLKAELETKHRMEMTEVEERKNIEIGELTSNHNKWFNDMKNYYNDITLNNLALISSLKEQMEALRKQNERMTKQVHVLTTENNKQTVALKKAHEDVTEYKRQLTNYEKDKVSLEHTKVQLSMRNKELNSLQWTNEALELRFEKLQSEKNELHDRFLKAILEVQQKTSFKIEMLNRRNEVLQEAAQSYRVEIEQMKLTADPSCNKTDTTFTELLQNKTSIIKDLQYELARVCKAHDDLLETYEEKLYNYGIPKQELGYTPLKFDYNQVRLPKGPAGLVTKNI